MSCPEAVGAIGRQRQEQDIPSGHKGILKAAGQLLHTFVMPHVFRLVHQRTRTLQDRPQGYDLVLDTGERCNAASCFNFPAVPLIVVKGNSVDLPELLLSPKEAGG